MASCYSDRNSCYSDRIFATLMGIFATLIGVEKSFQVVRKVGPGQRFKPEVFSSSNI